VTSLVNILREEPGGKISSTRALSLSVVALVTAEVSRTGDLSWIHVSLVGMALLNNLLGGFIQRVTKKEEGRTKLVPGDSLGK